MTDAERIARLERLVKTLLRGLAPGTFGVHRTRRADADELAAALAWLNSDEPELHVTHIETYVTKDASVTMSIDGETRTMKPRSKKARR
jgi:hypothetical protein